MTYPSRAEVWLVDLGLAAKVRPCVVVSSRIADADRALITLVPHTTSVRRTAYEANLKVEFLKPGAFDAQGIVTVPVAHAVRLMGRLRPDDMKAIEAVLCRWLGLPCHEMGESAATKQ